LYLLGGILTLRKQVVGVIGAGNASAEDFQAAYELGGHIASRGLSLVCGGLGGIMEAAAKGASEKGGLVIGILPGDKKTDANPYIHLIIPSGLGIARNVLIVQTADVIIAFPGSFGTLSEIALALAIDKTVIYFPGAWDLKRIGQVDSSKFKEVFDARQAIGLALDVLSKE
jgi:uncharacterized protein (TIGR00725 family)